MKLSYTPFIIKTPLFFLLLTLLATGCHTPEDLKEIGPQQEFVESEWNPKEVNGPSLIDTQSIHSPKIGGSDGEVSKLILDLIPPIKTPIIPSRRRRTRECAGC